MAVTYELSFPALDDPYPLYAELREHDPIHYSSIEDVWVLTRFDDCLAAFSDWRTWSSQRRGNLLNDLPERIGRTLGTTDPPRHTMARKLVNKAFTPTTVAVLEPRVRALAVELADRAATEGDIEFVADVSAPFNAFVLGALFGLAESEFLQLRHWLDDFFLREKSVDGRESRQAVAMRNLRAYLDGLLAERVAHPGDDLMSAMLGARDQGERLSDDQVVVTTMTFLTAGFESVNNFLTNTVRALALDTGARRRVRDDLTLLPAALEEVMRWDAPAQGFVRTPTHDVELRGTTIPEGAQVLVHIGAANRDPERFPDPDRFDIDRDTQRHLGLGHGNHFCVGAPLARSMGRVLFEELLARSKAWEVDLAGGIRVTTPNFRGFSVLPVRP